MTLTGIDSVPDSNAFARLNDDVLLKIFEVLRPNKELRALSSTCRWLRDASCPVLFHSCYQRLGPSLPWTRSTATYEILPASLWPHVRILELDCRCPAYSEGRRPRVVDPLVCDAFNTIDATLPSLFRLTTLRLDMRYIDVHGISWKSKQTILSLPPLRHLHIDGLYICPELLDDDILDGSTITPLATLHYTLPHYRQPLNFPSELTVLDFLLHKLHTSLESLLLPVECAPMQTISSLHWPRLREFTLRGERWSDPATPGVTLFSSMPSLRSLALELSEPQNAVPGPRGIWPKGVFATLPWPCLDTLRVSYPDPADGIYPNLPPSLNTLALRSWPHVCIQIFDERREHQPPSWYQGREHRRPECPLLGPGRLAQVLLECECSPNVHTLELEYRADAHESELLRALVVKFPHLTTLEIHRFRSIGEYSVAEDFAGALVSLTSLRLLKLNLDSARMHGPSTGRMMIARNVPRSEQPSFDDTLASAAELLSRTLAPTLEEIWMFKYDYHPVWVIFTVNGVHGNPAVVMEKDYRRY